MTHDCWVFKFLQRSVNGVFRVKMQFFKFLQRSVAAPRYHEQLERAASGSLYFRLWELTCWLWNKRPFSVFWTTNLGLDKSYYHFQAHPQYYWLIIDVLRWKKYSNKHHLWLSSSTLFLCVLANLAVSAAALLSHSRVVSSMDSCRRLSEFS